LGEGSAGVLPDLRGQQLGRYELRETIGSGGMGAVYRAYQANLDRFVAVKVLPLGASEQFLARFTQEARIIASLEHTNIVPVYDYGHEGPYAFIAMRLLAGGTLADRIHTRGAGPSLTLRECADVVTQLAHALGYAHARGVIHRDIKASNVLFDEQGNPYLVDFGVARLAQATSQLTAEGFTVGTPAYMSPEQWQGGEIGPAADQYALAVLAYYMVSGAFPFEADTPYALMARHLNEKPVPVSTYRHDAPDALWEVLQCALAKAPTERYANVERFAEAFQAAVDRPSLAANTERTTPNLVASGPSAPVLPQPPPTVPPPPGPSGALSREVPPVPTPRRGRGGLWMALALVALLLLVLGGVAVVLVNVLAPPAPPETPAVALVPTRTLMPLTPFRTVTPLTGSTSVALAATPITTPAAPAVSCDGLLPSRLTQGWLARVDDADERPLNVRAGPGTGNPVIGRLPVGGEAIIVDGPVCQGGYTWYGILYNGGLLGWAAEGDASAYFLEPAGPAPAVEAGIFRTPAPAERLLSATCAVLLVEEDFAAGDSGYDWYQGGNPQTTIMIEPGAYHIRSVADPEAPAGDYTTSWGSLGNTVLTDGQFEGVVGAQPFTDAGTIVGLWTRLNEEEGGLHYISFTINGAGEYRIGRSNGSFRALTRWVPSAAIRTGDGASNTLRIDSAGPRLTFHINGQAVETLEETEWLGGRIGFVGASTASPADFWLDYVRICGF
jgi:serine/threonine protein kinase